MRRYECAACLRLMLRRPDSSPETLRESGPAPVEVRAPHVYSLASFHLYAPTALSLDCDAYDSTMMSSKSCSRFATQRVSQMIHQKLDRRWRTLLTLWNS